MGSLGGPELLIVLAVLVLLFGARKLPELGSSVGRSIKNFKQGMAEASTDDTSADTSDDESVDSAAK